MELKGNALMALDAIHQRPTRGIPSWGIYPMEHRIIDRLAGAPEGTYKLKPIETYLQMQRNNRAGMIDQFIPTNPLSIAAHGYEAGGQTATTGLKQIIRDGMLIDSPEAVVAHLEQKVLPQLNEAIDDWKKQPETKQKERAQQIRWAEETTQLLLGPDILKTPYGVAAFPGFAYGAYGYENYFSAYALYPEIMERHFSLQADLAVHINRGTARAYSEGELPPFTRLDHDMADSRGTLVDIKSLDKIWFPHFVRSINPLLDEGVKLIWHCDGNLMQMVPRLLEAGLHGFQGFQYEDGMDYEKICRMKTREGNSLIIIAGVSVTRTLPSGTPEDVRREMKWLVEHGPRTGLFLGGSSSITPGVTWENMKTFVEGLNYYRQHGRNESDAERLPPKKQLEMIYPAEQLSRLPEPILPPEYRLRQYCPQDEKAYLNLMAKAGFKNWTREILESSLKKALPDGFFVIVHEATQQIVASAMATHNPRPEMPFGGELGWTAGDPEHAGHGLGQAVCAAVVRRFAQAGYRNVYLLTDDFRLPAIKIYLKLGFKPFIRFPDMEARWQMICSELKWSFEPVRTSSKERGGL